MVKFEEIGQVYTEKLPRTQREREREGHTCIQSDAMRNFEYFSMIRNTMKEAKNLMLDLLTYPISQNKTDTRKLIFMGVPR